MFASVATSPSEISMPLTGGDARSTAACLRQLGVSVEWDDTIQVVPAEWRSPSAPLDCGNSGTTMRLLSGLLASRPLECTLVGDHSLSRRPMKRIAEPLRLMGATVEGDTPPLHLVGGDLQGIRYVSPVASAQIKSCVLLAGLRASGETWVREPELSRDHTERMLAGLGVTVMRGEEGVGVRGGASWEGFSIRIPGDISSAAFFMVAAAILPGAELTVEELSINPTRTGLLDVFAQCGIPVEIANERELLGEPVADVTVRTAPVLKPFQIDGPLVPRLIDEIPVLAVLASQCEGTSEIRDARELRVKESDRIENVAQGLRTMGVPVETFDDGMAIEGPVSLRGAVIDVDGDHRIAMAFAIAGLIAEGETILEGAEAIATSFPTFESELYRLVQF